MLAIVAEPRSLKIFTAIHLAPGATPTPVPPADPPTITPIVQVPWPLMSVGVVGCWPFGSYQLFEPPRQDAARSGWVASTPESMFATTTPWPRSPRSHTAGALTRATFDSAAAVAAVAAVDAGPAIDSLSLISWTSGRAASRRMTAGFADRTSPSKIQSDSTLVTLPSLRFDAIDPRIPCWASRALA